MRKRRLIFEGMFVPAESSDHGKDGSKKIQKAMPKARRRYLLPHQQASGIYKHLG
jgi:hypothetical protein